MPRPRLSTNSTPCSRHHRPIARSICSNTSSNDVNGWSTMFALFCLTTKNAKNTKEKEQKNFALFVFFVVNSSLVGTNLQR